MNRRFATIFFLILAVAAGPAYPGAVPLCGPSGPIPGLFQPGHPGMFGLLKGVKAHKYHKGLNGHGSHGGHGGHGSHGIGGISMMDGQFLAGPDYGLAPVTVEFSTLVSRGTEPFTYNYDFGDGATQPSGGRQVSHTYQAKGNYTAKVTVTDAKGSQLDLSVKVRVLDAQGLADSQSDLRDNADQAAVVAQPSDMEEILSDARDLINQSLRSVAGADDVLRTGVETAVRTDAGDLLANTKDQLRDWIAKDQILPSEVEEIAEGIGDVVSNMVINELPISEQTLEDVRTASGDVFDYMAGDLLKNENLTQAELDEITSDDAKARDFLDDKPWLLNDVVEVSGIKVDVNTPFDTDEMEQAATDHGLSSQQAAQLITSVEPTPDVTQTVALSSVSQQTIAQVAEEIFNTYYATGKTVTQAVSDPVTRNILLVFDDGTYLAFLVNRITIVSDYAPPGLYDLPDGTMLGIVNSYAINYVAYPVYPLSLAAGFIKLGAVVSLDPDGELTIGGAAPGAIWATRIGWELFLANALNAVTTSFSTTGGSDPSAEAYSLLVTYDGGASQLLPPTVHAMDDLTVAFDAMLPGIWSIDNDTGVITIDTYQFKPDYTFVDLTSIDYNQISTSGGVVYNPVAFALEDYNGDGVPDFGFYSNDPMGFQILYLIN